jgi:hypothetical protein
MPLTCLRRWLADRFGRGTGGPAASGPDPRDWELFSIDRPDDMASMHPDMRVVTLRRPDGAVPEYRQFAGRECYWRWWPRMEPQHGFSPILTHWFQMRKRHLADGGTLPDIEAEARFWTALMRGEHVHPAGIEPTDSIKGPAENHQCRQPSIEKDGS